MSRRARARSAPWLFTKTSRREPERYTRPCTPPPYFPSPTPAIPYRPYAGMLTRKGTWGKRRGRSSPSLAQPSPRRGRPIAARERRSRPGSPGWRTAPRWNEAAWSRRRAGNRLREPRPAPSVPRRAKLQRCRGRLVWVRAARSAAFVMSSVDRSVQADKHLRKTARARGPGNAFTSGHFDGIMLV